MNKKRILSVLCLLLCVMLLATACDSSDTKQDTTTDGTTATTAEFNLITSGEGQNNLYPIPEGETTIEITLEEQIAHTVACSELISGAVQNVSVTLYHKNSDGTKGAVAGTMKTNAKGEAVFYFSEAGNYLVEIDPATVPDGFQLITETMELTSSKRKLDVNFVSPGTKSDKTFTVKNADGTPAANVTVKLYDTTNTFVAQGVTDANGQVTVKELSVTTNFKVIIEDGGNVLEETGFDKLGVAFNATDITVTLTDLTQIPDVDYTVKLTKKEDEAVLPVNLTVTVFRIDSLGNHIDVGEVLLLNGEGKITLQKRDDYFVKLNSMPQNWQISGGNPYAGFLTESNVATFVLDDAGLTETDPIIWDNSSSQAEGYSNVVYLTLNAGQVIWCEAQNPESMMIVIENANAVVNYNGKTYTAENGVVSVMLEGTERAKFSVSVTKGASVEVLCKTLPGTSGNPYVLPIGGDERMTVDTVAGEESVYFQFTATRDCTLEVSTTAAKVSINDSADQSTSTAAVTLKAGDTVLIAVTPNDSNATSVTVTWSVNVG